MENGADNGNEERESTALVALDKPGPGVSSFSSIEHFKAAQRMAQLLASSTLVPSTYQGGEGVANCVLALELASRIGASVFMVMQNLHIIKGKPSWSSTFLIATVNTCGRFTPLGFRFVGEKGTDSWGCEAHATSKATGEELVGEAVTIEMAKADGWYGRKDSKWPHLPGQMLRYRSAAFWVRVYTPELALGMQTTEEIYDVEVVDAAEETKAKTITRVEELRKRIEDVGKTKDPDPEAEEAEETFYEHLPEEEPPPLEELREEASTELPDDMPA